MDDQTFLFEDVAPGVRLLTLNRPERLNAVNWAMGGLQETLGSLRHQHDVRAVVLTGAGRAFCAGLDIKDPESLDPDDTVHAYDLQELFGGMCVALREVPVPVIAAVNGVASGAGLGSRWPPTSASRRPRRGSTWPTSGSASPGATWAPRTCCRASSGSGWPAS